MAPGDNTILATVVLLSRVTGVLPNTRRRSQISRFGKETWSEQEALYYLPHSPANCSETSDSSSTASTTKRKRNTWSTAEDEISFNLCGEHKSGLKWSGSSQKWQQNITTWSSKSAILLIYLMTSIELPTS